MTTHELLSAEGGVTALQDGLKEQLASVSHKMSAPAVSALHFEQALKIRNPSVSNKEARMAERRHHDFTPQLN